ncbi:microsomal epoxide hydrolase [Cladophialophora psammophila CBS 110553]|uniref:Microsomal epoxide hydrolase n=1 Tax=Cladophialophora psammophila CBS 110553 TaxID=1182543 RepID=W9W4I4_9EURO|nr:microsomal epoxide hydrolase [Cladophialophora psammophila CBS 110553]EXJ59446.1 microsomal epoxide hydrolase [Cladophialophora psammophila CBS 110553]
MADIEPFTIVVPDSALLDLKTRLSLARFPDELEGAAWDYGAPLADVQRLTRYWKDTYNWREAEKKLNELPNYRTTIQVEGGFEPLKVHFLHQRSRVENAIPLLFVHGWPGSFIEAVKIWDKLPSPDPGSDDPAFHFVAISLPNYGFSEAPRKKGFAVAQYAETCHKLMLKLGYDEYVTQGGDWGYYITRALALLYPQHCKATHVNFDQGEAPSLLTHPTLAIQHALTPYTAAEKEGLKRTSWFLRESSGYRAQQATRPQTLGYALADSPVALLAWIYEKLHDWSDAYPWTDDEVCTWLSIYWFSTAGPAASLRIYYESTHEWDPDPARRVTRDRTRDYIGGGVKLGLSHAPKELRVLPSTWTRTQGDVVFERSHPDGGHFYAWERPEHLLRDVRDMFGKKGGARNVVKGKSGY